MFFGGLIQSRSLEQLPFESGTQAASSCCTVPYPKCSTVVKVVFMGLNLMRLTLLLRCKGGHTNYSHEGNSMSHGINISRNTT